MTLAATVHSAIHPSIHQLLIISSN